MFPEIVCGDSAPRTIILVATVAPVAPSASVNAVVLAPAPAAFKVCTL